MKKRKKNGRPKTKGRINVRKPMLYYVKKIFEDISKYSNSYSDCIVEKEKEKLVKKQVETDKEWNRVKNGGEIRVKVKIPRNDFYIYGKKIRVEGIVIFKDDKILVIDTGISRETYTKTEFYIGRVVVI